MYTNLYEETVEAIERAEYHTSDVLKVIYDDSGVYSDWKTFAEEAKKTFYDNDYGTQEVLPSLKIILPEAVLERAEYDGAEWWRLMKLPPFTQKVEKVPYPVLACGNGWWSRNGDKMDLMP